MWEEKSIARRTPPSTHQKTTIVACCWGLSASYVFFRSLLIHAKPGLCVAAMILLVIVWATLERKRWGRLALQGLSVSLIAIYVIHLGLATVLYAPWLRPLQSALSSYACLALYLPEGHPLAVYAILALVSASAAWLYSPSVVAEFEQGKRQTLARAQTMIAMFLVGCWSLALLMVPLLSVQTAPPLTPLLSSDVLAKNYTVGSTPWGDAHQASRRTALSAESASKR